MNNTLKCSVCKQLFSRKDSLLRHQNRFKHHTKKVVVESDSDDSEDNKKDEDCVSVPRNIVERIVYSLTRVLEEDIDDD
jgi:gluconate kinase